MDELKIRTSFTKNIISRIIRKLIYKKFGYDVGIHIHELTSNADDKLVSANINLTADMSKNDLDDILSRFL